MKLDSKILQELFRPTIPETMVKFHTVNDGGKYREIVNEQGIKIRALATSEQIKDLAEGFIRRYWYESQGQKSPENLMALFAEALADVVQQPEAPEEPAPISVASPDLKSIRRAALFFIGKGYTPLPLPGGKKRPTIKNWQTLKMGVDDVDTFFKEGDNIGLRLDTLTDVDLDSPEALQLAPYFLESKRTSWGRPSAQHSHHLYLVKDSRPETFVDPTSEGKEHEGMLVEIRHGHGQQSMVPPSVHPNGELLAWVNNNSDPVQIEFRDLRRRVGKIAAGALLMRHLTPESGKRHWAWFYLGGAMSRAQWTEPDALQFVSAMMEATRDDEAQDRIAAVRSSFEQGKEEIAGLKKLEDYLPTAVVRKLALWLDLRQVKYDPLDLTDDANAQFIFAEYGQNLRFVPKANKGARWMYFNGVVWEPDALGSVRHLAALSLKKKAEQLLTGAQDGRFKATVRRELLDMPGTNGALERLSIYADVATSLEALDTNPWLVGLQNGIYDLKHDRLESGAHELLVTRQATVSYDPSARCPRWLVCLERVQPDVEIRAFLQRLAGSALLGNLSEYGLIFNFGHGANFKTMFAETLKRILGSYAGTPHKDLLFKSSGEVGLNYVAELFGRRLLTTAENEEGSVLNVSFIKNWTGGEKMLARHLYSGSFEFYPSARIIISANNKPRLKEFDVAMRRRFLLVPWDVTIPEEGTPLDVHETNPEKILEGLRSGARLSSSDQLHTLLAEEYNGIFNWMLEGARDFIKRGLRLDPPASIRRYTEEYFEDEDLAGRFVHECCDVVRVPGGLNESETIRFFREHGTATRDIYQAFTPWSNLGKFVWTSAKLTQRLEKVEGVIVIRGWGNRRLVNLVLNDDAKRDGEATLDY